jgi:hypothetical protein
MTILNVYLLHKSCGGKLTYKKFHETLVRDLTVQTQRGEYRGQWCFSREAKFIWGPSESTRDETLETPVIQKKTKRHVSGFKKKLPVSPLEFHNIYNK